MKSKLLRFASKYSSRAAPKLQQVKKAKWIKRSLRSSKTSERVEHIAILTIKNNSRSINKQRIFLKKLVNLMRLRSEYLLAALINKHKI